MLAQSLVNLAEITLCGVYVFLVLGGMRAKVWVWDGKKRGGVEGRRAAWAVLVGFMAGTVTETKTFLYCMASFFPFSELVWG